MPVFLERFLLVCLAAGFIAVVITNPMSFDLAQRVTLGLAIFFFAGFVAYTIHKSRVEESARASEGRKVPLPATIQRPEVKAADDQNRVFVGESITPEYLLSIFGEHTDIQSAKLTSAYLGKWMKVSGPLGNVISSAPTRAQLTFERPEVPLAKRTWFYYTSLFMMFREPWIDRLSIMKSGDKLTVIGQIARIDKISIQLENCELVGTNSK
jgi:hypothetical protein